METKHDLRLGPLQVNNITQCTVGLLGGKGTGKTTLMKMINYKLEDYKDLGLFIVDPLNVIHIAGFNRVTIGRRNVSDGAQLADILNQTPKDRVIISLTDMLQSEQATFMNDLFGNWKCHDAMISIDEMHDFCPEGAQHGIYCAEIERAVRHWRNRNIGFIFTTQRPAKLNKNILELADVLNINRMTGNNDREAVERYLNAMLPKEDVKNVLGDIQSMGFLQSYFMNFRIS